MCELFLYFENSAEFRAGLTLLQLTPLVKESFAFTKWSQEPFFPKGPDGADTARAVPFSKEWGTEFSFFLLNDPRNYLTIATGSARIVVVE